MALLQPQQQQANWFFLELEDDGGFHEVEVDMVGSNIGTGEEHVLGTVLFSLSNGTLGEGKDLKVSVLGSKIYRGKPLIMSKCSVLKICCCVILIYCLVLQQYF